MSGGLGGGVLGSSWALRRLKTSPGRGDSLSKDLDVGLVNSGRAWQEMRASEG